LSGADRSSAHALKHGLAGPLPPKPRNDAEFWVWPILREMVGALLACSISETKEDEL